MGVKFLNQNIVVNSTRPAGFKFPTGLTVLEAANTVVDYLVVAGGGGGSSSVPSIDAAQGTGGGGAGGMLFGSNHTLTQGTPYTITVGAGGPGAATTVNGTNGSNSSFSSFTSIGGGGGGYYGNRCFKWRLRWRNK
jgi:hypothetical protein